MDTHKPRKLSSFLSVLDKLGVDDDTCFRGQSELWELVPKIARIEPRTIRDRDERAMLDDFRRYVYQHVTPAPSNDWDLLAIAQHHGLATRLLDWTKNPLAALWFAVKDSPRSKDISGAVWAYFPDPDIDFVVDLDTKSPFDHGRSKFFVPNHVTSRIRAQLGLFSVQKPNKKSQFVPFEVNHHTKDRVRRIDIEPGYFRQFRYELDLCGVNRSTLFPDLDGIGQHLTWKNSFLDDEKG